MRQFFEQGVKRFAGLPGRGVRRAAQGGVGAFELVGDARQVLRHGRRRARAPPRRRLRAAARTSRSPDSRSISRRSPRSNAPPPPPPPRAAPKWIWRILSVRRATRPVTAAPEWLRASCAAAVQRQGGFRGSSVSCVSRPPMLSADVSPRPRPPRSAPRRSWRDASVSRVEQAADGLSADRSSPPPRGGVERGGRLFEFAGRPAQQADDHFGGAVWSRRPRRVPARGRASTVGEPGEQFADRPVERAAAEFGGRLQGLGRNADLVGDARRQVADRLASSARPPPPPRRARPPGLLDVLRRAASAGRRSPRRRGRRGLGRDCSVAAELSASLRELADQADDALARTLRGRVVACSSRPASPRRSPRAPPRFRRCRAARARIARWSRRADPSPRRPLRRSPTSPSRWRRRGRRSRARSRC